MGNPSIRITPFGHGSTCRYHWLLLAVIFLSGCQSSIQQSSAPLDLEELFYPTREDLPETSATIGPEQQDGGIWQEYDKLLFSAIESRWGDLLNRAEWTNQAVPPEGRVRVEFRLHANGRVTDMKIVENTLGDLMGLFCQKAILDPAPYGRWTNGMRKQIGQDYRVVKCTFNFKS